MLTREQDQFLDLCVSALRSGKYKQGKDYLHYIDDSNEECLCGLGVIVQTYIEHMNNITEDDKTNEKKFLVSKVEDSYRPNTRGCPTHIFFYSTYSEATNSMSVVLKRLPPPVQHACGFNSSVGLVRYSQVENILGDISLPAFQRHILSLTALNDAGMTFDQLADIIEARPSSLFLNSDD
jgi:hypothetical protein